MNYSQIAILFLQATLVGFVILLLFKLRKKQGIGMLFACLGLFQFMQVFLSSTVYVTITEGFLVSPGSAVLFPASLFAILIIYIKEDADEARKIIYALLIVNIVMSFFIQLISWNFTDPSIYNPFNVSTHLFDKSIRVLLVGTLALFLDSLLLIIIYEFLSQRIRLVFVQICITMLLVIGFDTVFFSILAFWNFKTLSVVLISGLISKGVFTIFYSIVFYVYLKYFDAKSKDKSIFKIKDIFQMLTYKQKFEAVSLDIIKASEEIEIKDLHYKTLTDISPVGVFQARSDGYTTFVNKRWCEISKVAEKDALGYGWLKAVHPEDKVAISQEWDSANAQVRRSEVNYRFVLPDGSIKWVLGQAVPQYDSHKQVIGYVGTITDITELKLFQQEQTFLRKKADESNRLKSAFLANMSHEIRTPMNGILGFSDLLRTPELSNLQQHRYIDIIEQSGNRMLDIIQDLIDISKVETDQVEIMKEKTNINQLLDDLYSFFKLDAEKQGLHLSYAIVLTEEESIIETDKTKLNQILTNLIGNALKFTRKGSIEFGYTKDEDKLLFYVKDSGCGIPLESHDIIFERFRQADANPLKVVEGSGLGLSISKAFIEKLGGNIWVESKMDQGSCFYFTIPYNQLLDEEIRIEFENQA